MELTGKRVLVTGADGFIGSHLVETLAAAGCDVLAVACYNSFNSWGWLDTLPAETLGSVEVITGDIRDAAWTRSVVKEAEVVFHLAALIAIPFSYRSVELYMDTNIRGTVNILQAAGECGVGRVLMTSTSEVYGTAVYTPIDENHPLQAQSPYSATKISAEMMAESFHRSFGLPVVIARPFNTYGPRQSARAVIPAIITQVLSGERRIRLGALHPTRDFNYVRDVCKGLVLLAACDEAVGRRVNIGSMSEISIGGLAAMISELAGAGVEIVTEEERMRPEKSEVERLVCDNSLMRRLTGWEPETSLRKGLSMTIEWFREGGNLERYKARLYNI